MTLKTPGCLVLAAGKSQRFGSPKLLHPLADGRPLIQHTLERVCATGLPVAVVHQRDDHNILQALKNFPVQRVANPQPEQGMGHSLALGVAATNPWQGWLICLADMPVIETSTYLAVAEALQNHPIVVPHYQNQPGHPRGFDSRFRDQLEALSGDQGARNIIKQHAAGDRSKPYTLPVDDRGILLDVDQPQHLQEL